ncbi:tumor necrosis factor ligand superfamily member 10-like isoform X1 [Ptychodera flava]|uniref:tumor necrosis factor ligand superfamily member 10-like isoform X1 n=1 Tax=Ptychodera flava TaxID=63121 RepID=UPI00396A2AD1
MDDVSTIHGDRSTASFGLSSVTVRQDSEYREKSTEKTHCAFQPTIIVIIAVQAVVILFVYPIIIAIVALSFQNEITMLEMSVQHLKDQQYQQQPSAGGNVGHVQGSDRLPDAFSDDHPDPGNSDDHDMGLLSCCSADSETLRELITKVTEEELRAVRNRRIGYVSERAVERMVQNYLNKNRTVISPAGPDSFTPSITPIAVHVVGHHEGFTKNRPIHDQAKMFKVGPWEYNNGPAIKLNVDVDFHHLMVPENGVYHVYSQVYFCDERSSGERQNETINEFLHFTVLDSTGYSSLHMDLMKSGRSKIGGDENGYYFSSYHSGLFELRKHDKIYMKVHLQHEKIIVSRDHEATFMGMYRIGDSY